MSNEKKIFTESDLKNFNGRDGRPAYVVYGDDVYDVSKSNLWAEGTHMGVHQAGGNLSNSLANAPHDEEKLHKYPIVGVFKLMSDRKNH